MIPNEHILKFFEREFEALAGYSEISESEKERMISIFKESLENPYLNAKDIYNKIIHMEGRET